jgi:hypothetical protein
MKKLFDYPSKGWPSESEYSAKELAIKIYRHATRLGLSPRLLNPSNPSMVGWDKIVGFEGVYIQLIDRDYGCTLNTVIGDEEMVDRKFFRCWKDLVDEGLCDGGPYVRGLINMTKAQRLKEAAELAGSTMTYQQIADRLYVSVATVKRDFNELGIKRRKKEPILTPLESSQENK